MGMRNLTHAVFLKSGFRESQSIVFGEPIERTYAPSVSGSMRFAAASLTSGIGGQIKSITF
jgi:hypothetical protein